MADLALGRNSSRVSAQAYSKNLFLSPASDLAASDGDLPPNAKALPAARTRRESARHALSNPNTHLHWRHIR